MRQFKPGQLQTGSLYNISASYAITASHSLTNSPAFPFTGSARITGSLGVTGSISTTTRFLHSQSLDSNNRILYDAYGINSITWNSRLLANLNGISVLDWSDVSNRTGITTIPISEQLSQQRIDDQLASQKLIVDGKIVTDQTIHEDARIQGTIVYYDEVVTEWQRLRNSVIIDSEIPINNILGIVIKHESGSAGNILLQGNITFQTDTGTPSNGYPPVVRSIRNGAPLYLYPSEGGGATGSVVFSADMPDGAVRSMGHILQSVENGNLINGIISFNPSNNYFRKISEISRIDQINGQGIYAQYAVTADQAVSSSFATSASFASTASYVSSNFQYEVHVSQVDGNDTTGNGDLLKPVATIGKALLIVSASVASTDRRTIIVHPGTYIENITVNTTNTYFFSTGLLGANCLISGSVTVSAATRMSGLKMTNLIVSSSAPVYINNCAVDKQMTVSGSGYLEVQNTSLQCTSGIQVVGPASSGVIFENCSLYPLTVNNASAAVYIISCNQAITPTLTAGALTITRSTISSLTSGATSTALTTAAGSVLVLESCNVYNSLLTSHAAITANGFYSIKNIIYNRSASTLASLSGTGGPLATVTQFQYINADNINSTQGLTVTGSITVSGSVINNLTASYAISATQAVSASFASTASFIPSKTVFNQSVLGTGNIGFVTRSFTQGPNVTGTTSEVQVFQLLIPSDTFSATDKLTFFAVFNRATATGTVSLRAKMSTSSSMPSGNTSLIARLNPTANNLYAKMARDMIISGGNIKGFANNSTANNDVANSTAAMSSQSLDVTVDNYFYLSVQPATGSDEIRLEAVEIKNI